MIVPRITRALQTGRILALLVTLGACDSVSRIPPDVHFDDLVQAEVAQLCRFSVDQVGGTEPSCVSFTRDYDTCRAEPPWLACPPGERTPDVGSWEDCVRASQACEATPDVCWHRACLP